jgi:PhnB protein
MTTTVLPHLNFQGDARAALAFYQSVFGGDLALVTYADAHNVQDPADADRVMWGQVRAPDGFGVMAYDVPTGQPHDRGVASFFVSVRGDDPDALTAQWERLADGATILAPLAPAQWAPLYGMLTDRFGITWVLDIAVAH